MRCPECNLAVNATTDQCPWCNALITPIADPVEASTPVKPPEAYADQGAIYFWIWMGNLFTAILGGVLITIALRGRVAWCLPVGIILVVLAAISLWASRFGTRWEGLSAGRKLLISLGMLGGAGVIVIPIVGLVVAAMSEVLGEQPSTKASIERRIRMSNIQRKSPSPLWDTERRTSPSPICPICGDPLAPGDKKCARCGK